MINTYERDFFVNMLRRIRKKGEQGFKDFVKSLETTLKEKRNEIIQTGTLDDAVYMYWIGKNLMSISEVVDLSEAEMEIVLNSMPNPYPVLVRAFFNLKEEEQKLFELLSEHQKRWYREEKEYVSGVSSTERESAQFYLFRTIRDRQAEREIVGPEWDIPPGDILGEQKPLVGNGIWTFLYTNGNVSARGELKNYKRHGPWKHFYPNGELMAEGQYHLDKRTGIWTFWHIDKYKMAEGHYEDDRRIGVWKMWGEDLCEYEKEYTNTA